MALKFKPMTNSMVEPLFHVASMLKRSAVLLLYNVSWNLLTTKLKTWFPETLLFAYMQIRFSAIFDLES